MRNDVDYKRFVQVYIKHEMQRKRKIYQGKNVPFSVMLQRNAHNRAKALSNNTKCGVITAQDEGVPPGQKFMHLGL